MATVAIGTATGTDAAGSSASAVLSAAQTGSAPSTNTADRGINRGAALLTIVTTVGATPTVTVDIQGSVDGADWWNVPYADVATPTTVSVAQLAPITTATTNRKILQPNAPWRYLRLNYTANTNVTLTVSVFV